MRRCNTNSNGDRNRDGDGNGNGYSYSYRDRNGYCDCYGNRNIYCNADTLGDPASANAKAAANAVPSADAVSEWAKKLKELQSNRELARQLASSLLCRGKGACEVKWRGELCEPVRVLIGRATRAH
jgi:hypothetical protein